VSHVTIDAKKEATFGGRGLPPFGSREPSPLPERSPT
jgi:hypothetical protein